MNIIRKHIALKDQSKKVLPEIESQPTLSGKSDKGSDLDARPIGSLPVVQSQACLTQAKDKGSRTSSPDSKESQASSPKPKTKKHEFRVVNIYFHRNERGIAILRSKKQRGDADLKAVKVVVKNLSDELPSKELVNTIAETFEDLKYLYFYPGPMKNIIWIRQLINPRLFKQVTVFCMVDDPDYMYKEINLKSII